MNGESHNDLFEIKINEGSKRFIRKAYPLVSISFLINSLLCVVFVCLSIYSLIEYRRTDDGTLLQWYLFLYPFYTIMHAIIATVGVYYYFLFNRRMKQSIINSDEVAFNSSFKYLYRNVVLFIISLIMAFLFAIFHVVTLITD